MPNSLDLIQLITIIQSWLIQFDVFNKKYYFDVIFKKDYREDIMSWTNYKENRFIVSTYTNYFKGI